MLKEVIGAFLLVKSQAGSDATSQKQQLLIKGPLFIEWY
jgi:hypothetical protein